MPSSSSSKETLISVDNCEFKLKHQRLNSPRSIEACNRLGINPSDLYFIDFQSFMVSHPELRNLPRQLQQFRYDHVERLRKETLALVKGEREKLIKSAQNSTLNSENNVSGKRLQSSSSLSSMSHRMEKMISEEKKTLEKIKQKQKQEIQNLIENQIKSEIMRRNSDEKDRKMRMREQAMKEELLKKMQMNEAIRKEKEEQRQQELSRLLKERNEKIRMKQLKEEKKMKELAELEQRKQNEIKQRAENEMKNVNRRRNQLEAYLLSQEEMLNQKRLMNEQKERELKEHMEK